MAKLLGAGASKRAALAQRPILGNVGVFCCGKLGGIVEKCLHISTNVNKTWNMVFIYSNFRPKT